MNLARKLAVLTLTGAAATANATGNHPSVEPPRTGNSTSVTISNEVNANAASQNQSISIATPPKVEIVEQKLGPCAGPAYQALFHQVTTSGLTNVEGKFLFGKPIGKVSVTTSHTPNLVDVQSNSFSLLIPGSAVQNERVRIQTGLDLNIAYSVAAADVQNVGNTDPIL